MLLLVVGISFLFGLILWPFAGAILWAVVLAILFSPLNERLLALMPGRRNTAALLSIAIIVVMVVVPVAFVTTLLVQEIADVSGSIWQGILLLAYGLLVIETVDNLLRPVLVGKGAKVPDHLVLVTTVGGISTIGANGFVVGPVIVALFLATWHVLVISRAEKSGPPNG